MNAPTDNDTANDVVMQDVVETTNINERLRQKLQDDDTKTLNLADFGTLTRQDCVCIGRFVRNHFHLTEALLSGNEIDSERARAILQGVPQHPALTKLDLSWNDMGREGASNMVDALNQEGSLVTHLNVSFNRLGNTGVRILARLLWSEQQQQQQHAPLETLHVAANQFTSAGMNVLAQAIQRSGTLRCFHANLNRIGETGCASLGNALKGTTHLRELHLAYCRIGSLGCRQLHLAENRSLQVLDLSYNEIGYEGARELARAFRKKDEEEDSTTLTTLLLQHNEIGNDGATHLSNILVDNGTLIKLDLSENELGGPALEAFARVVVHNRVVQELELYQDETEKLDERARRALQTIQFRVCCNKHGFWDILKEGNNTWLLPWDAVLAGLSTKAHGLDLVYSLLQNRPDIIPKEH